MDGCSLLVAVRRQQRGVNLSMVPRAKTRKGKGEAMSKTPRTDYYRSAFKASKEKSNLIDWLLDEFAQLETELAECKAKLSQETASSGDAWLSQHAWQERAEAAEAKLAAYENDAERYRWLRLQKEHLMICFEDAGPEHFGLADVCQGLSWDELDAAIDAAKAEDHLQPSSKADASNE